MTGEEIDLSETNLDLIGSDLDKEQRQKAAATDPMWQGAGEKVGCEIWRVENKRCDVNDIPEFGVNRWPESKKGQFHTGDSYIVLSTTEEASSKKLLWNVHFWIGKESSQDEYGVAAYKSVELDDLLRGSAVQHREVQGKESRLFKSYFKSIKYLEGGIASGFKKVQKEKYTPKMYHVKCVNRNPVAEEVPIDVRSLREDGCFVLDTGDKVFAWFGEESSPFDRNVACTHQNSLISASKGKARKANVSKDFWDAVGGNPIMVQGHKTAPEEGTPKDPILWRLSDSTGKLRVTQEKKGGLRQSDLDSDDVFFVDAGEIIFGWVGTKSNESERRNAIILLSNYVEKVGRFMTPCARVLEGQETQETDFRRFVTA